MYKEGHCGGGYYSFKAQLLTEDGQVTNLFIVEFKCVCPLK